MYNYWHLNIYSLDESDLYVYGIMQHRVYMYMHLL